MTDDTGREVPDRRRAYARQWQRDGRAAARLGLSVAEVRRRREAGEPVPAWQGRQKKQVSQHA
jgi:hypothetical protein